MSLQMDIAQNPVMVGGINPIRRRSLADDLAAVERYPGEGLFMQEQVVDPSIRKPDGVRLDKRILVVPRDPGVLRVKLGEQVAKTTLPDSVNRRMIRGGVHVSAYKDHLSQWGHRFKQLFHLSQTSGSIRGLPGQMRGDDPEGTGPKLQFRQESLAVVRFERRDRSKRDDPSADGWKSA